MWIILVVLVLLLYIVDQAYNYVRTFVKTQTRHDIDLWRRQQQERKQWPLLQFTLEQLHRYKPDCHLNRPHVGLPGYGTLLTQQSLCLAIQGRVYDVSCATRFYGKGGMYCFFTGHDITYALAKESLESEDYDRWFEIQSGNLELTPSESENLKKWLARFSKYMVIGELVSE